MVASDIVHEQHKGSQQFLKLCIKCDPLYRGACPIWLTLSLSQKGPLIGSGWDQRVQVCQSGHPLLALSLSKGVLIGSRAALSKL